MTKARSEVLTALNLSDIWEEITVSVNSSDLQGWNSDHRFLLEAVAKFESPCIVEVGVWKGASVVTMARELKRLWSDGVVIAVDTFLGSTEHYRNLDFRASLRIQSGYPRLFDTFLGNMASEDVLDYVVPIPLDSVNAAHLLSECNVRPQVVHIDAGHDYESVSKDLNLWFGLLEPGGVVICDDYTSSWPGVTAAVDEFILQQQVDEVEVASGKVRFTKSSAGDASSDLKNQVQADLASQFVDLQRRYESVTSSRIWRWTTWLHG